MNRFEKIRCISNPTIPVLSREKMDTPRVKAQNMRRLLLIFLVFVSLRSFGQADHLLPADGFFDVPNSVRDYYPFVYKHLVKELSDMPVARVITLPSFSPENVLSVESLGKEKRTYKLIYVTGAESIWYKKNRNTLPKLRYEEPLDTSLVNIISRVFRAVTSEVRYPEDNVLVHGLDGVTYVFSTFVPGQGTRAGQVWSPDGGTRMNELVQFAQAMTLLAKSVNDQDRATFREEIKTRGEKLLRMF